MPLDTPLTNVQETVERSIYHSLRAQCVAKGYTPNIFNYPKTEPGFKSYLAAFAPIIVAKGFSIEVFNTGAPADRVSKQLPRIVISHQGYLPGSIGGDQSHIYELKANDKYARFTYPPSTSDYYFNLHIVSNNTEQNRILSALIALAVPRKGDIKIWDSETNAWGEGYIFCNHLSYVPVRQSNSPGTMETMYRYVIPDIFETAFIDNDIEISPLKEIDLNISDVNFKIE